MHPSGLPQSFSPDPWCGSNILNSASPSSLISLTCYLKKPPLSTYTVKTSIVITTVMPNPQRPSSNFQWVQHFAWWLFSLMVAWFKRYAVKQNYVVPLDLSAIVRKNFRTPPAGDLLLLFIRTRKDLISDLSFHIFLPSIRMNMNRTDGASSHIAAQCNSSSWAFGTYVSGTTLRELDILDPQSLKTSRFRKLSKNYPSLFVFVPGGSTGKNYSVGLTNTYEDPLIGSGVTPSLYRSICCLAGIF